ncbi:hypothetical protein E3N88_07218 [Mikania micrantha]|uniref:Uncharacterized protein n=1 Tax=Mikania micrantha TaxID=192012 RepID=A0A5N6PRZ2_9ASTR|nr:hypothetical protein E3N88_07218 [Mikania micrantha]
MRLPNQQHDCNGGSLLALYVADGGSCYCCGDDAEELLEDRRREAKELAGKECAGAGVRRGWAEDEDRRRKLPELSLVVEPVAPFLSFTSSNAHTLVCVCFG